jgi:hypothetical protein
MSKLDEAEQKLKFADYLLQRENNAGLLDGAMKHILQAANKAVAELLVLDDKSAISPLLIGKKLAEGSEKEKEFSAYYLGLWKMTLKPATAAEVTNAYKRVRLFVDYVREVRIR